MNRNRKYIVEFEGNHLELASLIRPVIQAFADKSRVNIRASNPHREERAPYGERRYGLCIYFWSIPDSQSDAFASGEIMSAYEFPVMRSQRDAYILTNCREYRFTKIIDLEGNVLAVIAGKTLYILFDLPHGSSTERNHASEIMERILNDLNLFWTNRVGFDLEMNERLERKEERQFVRICRDTLLALDENEKATVDELRRVRAEFMTNLRRRKELHRGKFASMADKFTPENLGKLYETLCRLSSTGSIRVHYHSICIPIGQIDIEYDDVIYDIGEFELWIDLLDEYPSVCCINTTRTVENCHHPHVNSDGDPCLGNLNGGVDRLIKEGDLVSLVLVMKDILRSYNEDGPFVRVKNWPEKLGRRSKKVVDN